MKRFCIRAFLYGLVVLTSPNLVFADEFFTKDGFTYSIDQLNHICNHEPAEPIDSSLLSVERYQAVSGTDYSQPLHIPATVTHDGKIYSVITIDPRAFKGATEVQAIVIDEGIEYIRDMAFEYCINLKSIYIPASVKGVGEGIFGHCYSLTSVVVDAQNECFDSRDNSNAIIDSDNDELVAACSASKIPSSVKSIGNWAFSYCNTMEELIVPQGVEEIGLGAFSGCSSLKSISLPESLMEIGGVTFEGCNSLTSIVIPKNVKEIAPGIFGFCNRLTSIRVDSANLHYDSRSDCNGIVRKSDSALVAACKATTIGDDICVLDERCFYGILIHSLNIPKSITKISSDMFAGCYEIDEITVAADHPVYISPEGSNALLTKDGKTLVLGCRTTEIPDGVETIGEEAFSGRFIKVVLSLPESVKNIEDDAFTCCNSIFDVILPESVQSMGSGVFQGCANLTSVQILSPIKQIGDRTFANCPRLSFVSLPEGLEEIKNWAFDGCTSLQHITLPSSVTKIEPEAFSNCPALEKK